MAQLWLLLTCLIASASTQCTIERAGQFFKRSVYEFSAQLASRISLETDGHFIASGLSPWTLISALSLGARQETYGEIVRVLRMHPHHCFNEKYFEIARQLSALTNDTTLERSAAIFVDQKLSVKDTFQYDVQRTGICDIEVLSFDEAASTAAYINDFVSKATHETIDEIVSASDLEDASLIMVDALFFKGVWKIQFPYADTETSAFYNEKGNQIGDVNLMYVNGRFNITRIKQIKAQVLELCYGYQDRYSMLFFLPYKGVTVTSMLEKLNLISIRTIYAMFQRFGESTVDVQIPRFKITSDINNLKELLIDMGLAKMFDPNEANLENLADFDLFVSNFIQKADIEVTEDGTVAAAASEAILEARMLGDQFVANRPFLFMIVDKVTEIPLFTGGYSKPNVF